MKSTIAQFATAVHEVAKSKGWHSFENETPDYFLTKQIGNIHGEVSELWEAYRLGKLHDLCDKAEKMAALGLPPLTCIEEEFADIIIRVLDASMRLGVDIERACEIKHAFNATREFRHGNKLA